MLANYRRRVNYIEELLINVCPTKGNNSLREGGKNHFMNLYTECISSRPRLDDLSFNMLNEIDCTSLEMKLTEEEILNNLQDYDGVKAPRPDNFNLKFVQTF